MYEAYFGLSERPFSIAPDPRYLYLSARHREALAHLLYGIRERGGFVQLTGEVGTGKTTVTRALLEQLPEDVDIALILNPNVTVREFLLTICEELGAPLPSRTHSTQTLVTALNEYLLDAYSRGRHTVVLIDEAQCLSSLVIEQVRLLTNLETTREKLLQIILVGQPELKAMLARPELRQVAQRITARYHLAPLSLRETKDYIRHRLKVAGGGRPLFSPLAILAIHRLSGGIPRLINVICDRALLGAYASERAQAGLRTALRAVREIRGEDTRRRRRWPVAVAASTLLALGTAALGWSLLDRASDPAQVTVASAQREPDLDQRLQQRDFTTGTEAAFGTLFSLWQSRLRPYSADSPCEQAVQTGLRCYYARSALSELIKHNLPAVIELVDSAGSRHRAVLVGTRAGRVVLDFGGVRADFPLVEVNASFSGDSITLWRPPVEVEQALSKGSEGAPVQWLVARLARAGATSVTGRSRFDETVERAVRDFQRRQRLSADGIVGESTLFELLAVAPDPGAPSLRLEGY